MAFSKPLFCPVFHTASLALIHCDLSSSQSEFLTTFNASIGRIYRPLGNPPADAHLPFHPSTFKLPPHFLPLPSQPFLSPSNAQPPLKLITWTETGNLPTTRFSHPVHGPINEHTLNSLRPSFRPTWPNCTLHQPKVELVTAIIHYSLPSTWVACHVIFMILRKWWSSAAGNSSPRLQAGSQPSQPFVNQEGMPPSTILPFQVPRAMYDTTDLRTELQISALKPARSNWMLSSENLDNWRNEWDGIEIETTLISYRKIGFKGNHTTLQSSKIRLITTLPMELKSAVSIGSLLPIGRLITSLFKYTH